MLMKCSTNSVAQQRLHCQQIQLATAVYGRGYLQSLGERHSQEAASLFPHCLFLRLATMESNSEFNKKFMDLRLRRTYSLQ
jgi:hypothetical protein